MLDQHTTEFNQAILDTTDNLISVANRQGQIICFNKACEKATGYRFEEVKDRVFWDFLVAPEEMSAVKTVFEDLQAGNFPNTFENCWLTRTGARRLIRWSNTVLLDENQQVQYLIGTGVDITELRKAEAEAQQYHQLLQAVVEGSTHPIFVKDLEDRIMLANQVFASLHNKPLEEILGRNASELWPPQIARQFDEQDRETIATGLSRTTEFTILTPKNEIRTYLVTRDPYRDNQGRIIGVIALARDITERKKLETALQESEARFLHLFQSAPLPIILTRLSDGICRDVNLNFSRLLGYSREETIGHTVTEAFQFHPEQRQRLVAQIAQKGFTRDFEAEVCTKGGQLLQVLLNSEVIDVAGEKCLITALQDITERKNYEHQLKKWADLFQSINLGVIVSDASGQTIEMVNPALLKLMGYEQAEELIGQSGYKLLSPEYLQQLPAHLQNTQDQDYYSAEAVLLRKDGTTFPSHITRTLVRDKEGQILYRITTIQDITERRQTEEALKRSEELYRILAENIPDASVVLFDHDLRYLLADGPALPQYGFTREQMLGKTLWELSSPQSVAELEPSYRAALSGISVRYERSYGGGTFYCQAIPVRTPQGEIFAGLLMLQDITALKQTENALRESEELYHSLFDNSLYGVILANPRGEIKTANRAACQILGYTEEEIIARGRDGTLDQNDPRLPAYMERRLKSNSIQTELNFLRKDGTPINCELARSRYWDKNHQERSCIIFRDITERQKLEQERLKVSKLESLGVLAGGIAHDFNNVLTSIVSNLDLASLQIDQDHKDKALEHLDQALSSADRAAGLARQLLTFSRGGKPLKTELEPAAFLKEVIERIVPLELKKEGKSIKLTHDLPEDLWQLSADKAQLTQVLLTLLTNSVQASPDGKEITLKASNIELAELAGNTADHYYLKISVIDQGEGISGENLPKIFDPYFTTRRAHHGLGLALAYSIINNHGGHIEVVSEPGQGSTFSLYLPANPLTVTTPDLKNSEVRISSQNSDPAKSYRALVMDDDPNVREILGVLLQTLNWRADLSENGEEALRLYQQSLAENRPYNLVILDLTVASGMGGKETLVKLLTIDPGVIAIVSSGYSDNELIADYQSQGFKDVLPKPYKITQLKSILSKCSFSPTDN